MVYNIVWRERIIIIIFFKRGVIRFWRKSAQSPLQTPIATTSAYHVTDIINSRP